MTAHATMSPARQAQATEPSSTQHGPTAHSSMAAQASQANSQDSAASAITTSQMQWSSSNLSGSPQPDGDSTPPTSSDGPSSQSQGSQFSQPADEREQEWRQPRRDPSSHTAHHHAKDVDMSNGTGPGNALLLPKSPETLKRQSRESNLGPSGQKRTASGAIKGSSASMPTSPLNENASNHARHTSTDSAAVNTGEVIIS